MRGSLIVEKNLAKDELINQAKQIVQKWLENTVPINIIVIPNKLVNIVVK
jgi:leucyl-tRNA synthetase